mmetsp:Transcript_29813/g.86507  ORF Transcript_29813/g.86507 Transcript_29813/m.86507 type:complete len:315 (-) Transcript_29813:21-965(-)
MKGKRPSSQTSALASSSPSSSPAVSRRVPRTAQLDGSALSLRKFPRRARDTAARCCGPPCLKIACMTKVPYGCTVRPQMSSSSSDWMSATWLGAHCSISLCTMRQPYLCRASSRIDAAASSSTMNCTALGLKVTMIFCNTWFACGQWEAARARPWSSRAMASRWASVSAASSSCCTRRQPWGSCDKDQTRPATEPSLSWQASSWSLRAGRSPADRCLATGVASTGLGATIGGTPSGRSPAGKYSAHSGTSAAASVTSRARRALMGRGPCGRPWPRRARDVNAGAMCPSRGAAPTNEPAGAMNWRSDELRAPLGL